jgi:hypothetical protein
MHCRMCKFCVVINYWKILNSCYDKKSDCLERFIVQGLFSIWWQIIIVRLWNFVKWLLLNMFQHFICSMKSEYGYISSYIEKFVGSIMGEYQRPYIWFRIVKVTNCIKKSPCWEANFFSARQEIYHLAQNWCVY